MTQISLNALYTSQYAVRFQHIRPINAVVQELKTHRSQLITSIHEHRESVLVKIKLLSQGQAKLDQLVTKLAEIPSRSDLSPREVSILSKIVLKHGKAFFDKFERGCCTCIGCREALTQMARHTFRGKIKPFYEEIATLTNELILTTNRFLENSRALHAQLSARDPALHANMDSLQKIVVGLTALTAAIESKNNATADAVATVKEHVISATSKTLLLDLNTKIQSNGTLLSQEQIQLSREQMRGRVSQRLEESSAASHKRPTLEVQIFKYLFCKEEATRVAYDSQHAAELERQARQILEVLATFSNDHISRTLESLATYLSKGQITKLMNDIHAYLREDSSLVIQPPTPQHSKTNAAITVHLFHTEGDSPFMSWISMQTDSTRTTRLDYLRAIPRGHMPSKSSITYNVRPGISELYFGAYRVYVAVNKQHTDWLILGAGDKSNARNQTNDIETAANRFREYLQRKNSWKTFSLQ